MRPRQASVLACVVLAGTREGLEVQRSSSVNSLVGVAALSDPVGSFLVKIFHSVEGGDVEQGCSNLETNLPCLRLLYLSLICVYILHALIVHIHYLLDILVPYCYMLGDCLFTLVFNQESQSGTSTLI